MMCFRDRTYCSPKTCTGKCGREFTDKDHRDAIKWWGSDEYPLAVADFCVQHREKQQPTGQELGTSEILTDKGSE